MPLRSGGFPARTFFYARMMFQPAGLKNRVLRKNRMRCKTKFCNPLEIPPFEKFLYNNPHKNEVNQWTRRLNFQSVYAASLKC